MLNAFNFGQFLSGTLAHLVTTSYNELREHGNPKNKKVSSYLKRVKLFLEAKSTVDGKNCLVVAVTGSQQGIPHACHQKCNGIPLRVSSVGGARIIALFRDERVDIISRWMYVMGIGIIPEKNCNEDYCRSY